jgi:hypothetical protein
MVHQPRQGVGGEDRVEQAVTAQSQTGGLGRVLGQVDHVLVVQLGQHADLLLGLDPSRAQQVEELGQLIRRLQPQRRQHVGVAAHALFADAVEKLLPGPAQAFEQRQVGLERGGIRKDIVRRHSVTLTGKVRAVALRLASKKIGTGQAIARCRLALGPLDARASGGPHDQDCFPELPGAGRQRVRAIASRYRCLLTPPAGGRSRSSPCAGASSAEKSRRPTPLPGAPNRLEAAQAIAFPPAEPDRA